MASPLFLGTFEFKAFEVPEKINFGGKNNITTHRLSGGRRVFDVMGTEENDISWSGIILSTDAEYRATTLDNMRRAGTVVSLVFGAFAYDVLIEKIDFDYRQKGHIPYNIKCIVVDNKVPKFSSNQTLFHSIFGDVSSATAIVIDSGVNDVANFAGQVGTALASVGTAVAIAGATVGEALTVGSTAAQSLLAGVLVAQSTIAATEATAAGAFIALGAAPILSGGVAATAYLNSIAILSNQISEIDQAGNYIGRVVNNLVV